MFRVVVLGWSCAGGDRELDFVRPRSLMHAAAPRLMGWADLRGRCSAGARKPRGCC